MSRIIYLQTKEDTVNAFKDAFDKNGLKMQIAIKSEEVLKLAESEKILIAILDAGIGGNDLFALLDGISSRNTDVYTCVLVDAIDPAVITKLANKYSVDCIYPSPWDEDKIALNIKAAQQRLEADFENDAESDIASEKEELLNTLMSLKNTLKKQQKSYGKLLTLTKCFTDVLEERAAQDVSYKERLVFAEEVFSTLLKMQTTGSFDVEKFDEDIKRELQDIINKASGFEIGSVNSCLFGGQSRAKAQIIRFSIYLIARLYAQCLNTFKVDVDSHYITTKEAEFSVKITLPDKARDDIFKTYEEYYKYVYDMLDEITSDYRVAKDGNTDTYYLVFSVMRE